MKWLGFIKESKIYMNYPTYWAEWDAYPYRSDGWTMADKRRGKLKFWLAFPRAWLRFHWYMISDVVRA